MVAHDNLRNFSITSEKMKIKDMKKTLLFFLSVSTHCRTIPVSPDRRDPLGVEFRGVYLVEKPSTYTA